MPHLGILSLLCTFLLAWSIAFAATAEAQELLRWRVDPTPVTSIGEMDGAQGQLLTHVAAGAVLSDGTIVLQNSLQGLFEIRYYAPDGRHLQTVSRWGEGPFEFHHTLGLHPLEADSVLVLGQDDRFAVFGPAGEQVREGRAGLMPVMPVEISIPVDPRHAGLLKSMVSAMPEPGFHRGEVRVLMHDFGSGETRPLASVPGESFYYETGPGGSGLSRFPAPFGPRPHVAGGGGTLWIGDSDLPTIRGYRPEPDDPAIVVRVPGPRREVSRQDRRRIRDAYTPRFGGDLGDHLARFAGSMEIPDHTPWYAGIEVDRIGNLWVQASEPPGMQGPQRWWVYSPAGEPAATVEVAASVLPSCARSLPFRCSLDEGILEIGDDYLLVLQRDELGVERVRNYPLVKGG